MLLVGVALAASSGKQGAVPNPDPVTETVWGPDAYGYIARDNLEPNGPPLQWIDISGIGTVVTGLGDDNIVGPFGIGFPFRYYWYDVTSFSVGSNGYIRFSGGGQLADPFTTIPNPTPPNDVICPYTADFDPGSGGAVYYWSNGVDTLIVSYDHVPAWLSTGSSGDHNFQIVLSMVDTSITFNIGPQTGTFSNTNGMSGIENVSGTVGIQTFSTNAVPANRSIKFYYPQNSTYQVHDIAATRVQNDNSGGFFIKNGESFVANGTIKNVGNQNESNFYVVAEVRKYPLNQLVHIDSVLVGSLDPGESLDITFTETWTMSETGVFFVRIRSLLSDLNPSNNQKDAELRVVNLPGELALDDGTSEQGWNWSGGTGGMGIYYLPPTYPAKITQVSGYLVPGTGLPALLELYDDDGPGGEPGTQLASASITPTTATWYNVDVSGSNIVVNDGGIFAVWKMTGEGSPALGVDNNSISSRQTWEFTGVWGVFRNFETDDAMLRIFVEEGAPPVLEPPTNLSAAAGNGFVDLAWEAPLGSNEAELAYDDGTSEGNLSIGATAEGDLAVRFTPNVYPSTLKAIKVFFAEAPTGMTSIDWTIRGGTSTGPTNVLATGNQTINRGAFDIVDVSSAAVQITADDFFISYFEPNGQTMNLSWDTNQPSANRSWVNAPGLSLPWRTLGTVGASFDNNLMIRAIVLEGVGPNARLVELSPSGESRSLTPAEIKQLAYQRHLQGINPLTGAVSLDGSQLPQVGGNDSFRPGSSSTIEDLLSYNIYRSDNGASFSLLANVLSPTLSYTDNDVVNGTTYWYYVTAMYTEGESGPSDTVSATPIAPSEFFDDFESYAPGVQLTVQSTNWTTWSGTPGTGEDPFVSDAQAFSGSNSVVIVQNNDLVKTFGSLTSGKWKISFYVYIPTGKAGYFNTLAGFTPNPFNWGMECYFDLGGSGRLLGGSSTAVTFSWAPDTWQLVEVIVDLDNDLAEFRFNGASVHSWTWTLGASGGGSPLRLDASDLFGATANDQMYFDDYGIEEYIVGIGDDQPQIPAEFSLQQNYPNPFNPSTSIKYALKENANVTLKIYNMLGQEVKTLVSANQAAGFKEVAWDGTNNSGAKVASGIYIYRLEANNFVASHKMLLMK